MERIFLLSFAMVASISGSLAAQAPRLRLDTVGPASQIRALEFSANGRQLYSAGKDKVVRTWDVVDDNKEKIKLVPAHKFRWEISRASRGQIYDLSLSTSNNLIAFGGYSAWTQQADVAVYDLKSRKLVKKLFITPKVAAPIANIEFSPDGGRLAAITNRGELLSWSTENWQATQLELPTEDAQIFRPLAFLSPNKLAYARNLGESSELVSWNTNTGEKIRQIVNQNRLAWFEKCELGLVAASKDGTVRFWPNGKPSVVLRQTSNDANEVSAFVVTPDNRMVLVMTPKADAAGAIIEYWDISTRKRLGSDVYSKTDAVWATAVNYSGELIALAGNFNTIRLYRLKESNGNFIERPFQVAVEASFDGEGVKSRKVACAGKPGDYSIGLATDGVPNSSSLRTFDPASSQFRIGSLEKRDWRTAQSDAGQFRLKPSSSDPEILLVFRNELQLGTIRLDDVDHGRFASHCWIAEKGKTQPFALAIGTDDQNGIFIYDLRTSGGQLSMLRYYRDHEGRVESMATTADRKYLVSTSQDQTTKIWSLEGLSEPSTEFEQRNAWGADLKIENGALKVSNVLKAGLAHQKKLFEGTKIVGLWIKNSDGKNVNVQGPSAMLDAINRNPLNKGLIIAFQPPSSDPANVYVTPAWQPLLTLFFSRKNEWAAWTPEGYYNSSPLGDQLFGWQLNAKNQAEGECQFYRADQFRDKFERPNMIERLLTVGNVADALAFQEPKSSDQNDTPVLIVAAHSEVAEELPKVRVTSPKTNDELAVKTLTLTAEIEFGNPELAKSYNAIGLIDYAPLPEPQTNLNGNTLVCTWSVDTEDIPVGLQRFRAMAEQKEGGRFAFDDISFFVKTPTDVRAKPKLFIVGIAADRYLGNLSLQFPVKDVEAIIEQLPLTSSEHYESVEPYFFPNQQIDKETFAGTLDEVLEELKATAKPKDLLAVLVSGHGASQNGNYFFIPPTLNIEERSQLNSKGEAEGIPWDEFAKLANAPCRTVFLLDTCYAGDVLDGAKARLRPLEKKQAVVISSSSAGQNAYEDSGELKHGVFAYCVLQGLKMKADLDKNKVVDLDELIEYIERQVPVEVANVVSRGETGGSPVARGATISGAMYQKPTSSKNVLGFVPLASPKK